MIQGQDVCGTHCDQGVFHGAYCDKRVVKIPWRGEQGSRTMVQLFLLSFSLISVQTMDYRRQDGEEVEKMTVLLKRIVT